MIKKLFRKLFPKWKYIYRFEDYKFEGETLKRSCIAYREHPEHGNIQIFNWHSQGGDWCYLRQCETDTVKKKIKEGKYSYYITQKEEANNE